MSSLVYEFVEILQNIPKSKSLFNPYVDICPEFDNYESPQIRTDNLIAVLKHYSKFKQLVVGEAPGPHGARKSGLAFTSEHVYHVLENIWEIKEIKKATINDKLNKEASADCVWNVQQILQDKVQETPLLWNIIPFHPHPIDNYLGIRKPNKSDYLHCKTAIDFFFQNFKFEKIIAVGRVSEKYLTEAGFKVAYVRHPSMGGSKRFTKELLKLYGINYDEKKVRTLIDFF